MSSPINIATHLSILAAKRPTQPALLSRHGVFSCQELEDQSNRCAQGLKRIGIQPGTRTVLMVTPGIEFLILTFALIKINAVLVLVDPGMGWRTLKDCLGQARPESFAGTPLAHMARIFFGWGRGSVKTCLTVGSFKPWSGYSFDQLMTQGAGGTFAAETSEPDQPAAIVFTSGSTGVPKGVVYTHGMFLSQADLLEKSFQIEPGEVDLATFPLFALFDPALQMTTVFPEMDFTRPGRVDPLKIVESIQEYGVTHMFGSPALLDRVSRYGKSRGIKLPTLRRVLSAGAPVPDRVLKRFAALLSTDAQIHTPYGATEALPVCSITARELLTQVDSRPGRGICVGPPLEGVHLAVIGIDDGPIPHWDDNLCLPVGEIGELVVWGPNVSTEYFSLPEANELAKIQSPEGARHRMGDVGYLDEAGRVWFCGRKSQRVVTLEGPLFTVACEGVFNEHPKVYRSALVGLGNPPRQKPVLCVELEDGIKDNGSQELRQEILDLGAHDPQTRQIQTLLFHPSFPVDVRHNAKIFREQLARWASKQIS